MFEVIVTNGGYVIKSYIAEEVKLDPATGTCYILINAENDNAKYKKVLVPINLTVVAEVEEYKET